MSKRTFPNKKLKPVPRQEPAKFDWRKGLSKQPKTALINAMVELIEGDDRIAQQLARRFKIGLPPETITQDTRQAIFAATAYDPRDANRNFDYSYEAYVTIRKNFARLIKAGRLEDAMDLALVLMKSGSEQVEMSDEGLMTDDIEDCLHVVIKALKSKNLPAATARTWAKKMLRADRVGFICDKEIVALTKQS